MIIALAFVPLEKMDEYMDTLAAVLPDELIALFHWFEDNYIGRQNRRRNARMNPIFAPEIWNIYERIIKMKIAPTITPKLPIDVYNTNEECIILPSGNLLMP